MFELADEFENVDEVEDVDDLVLGVGDDGEDDCGEKTSSLTPTVFASEKTLLNSLWPCVCADLKMDGETEEEDEEETADDDDEDKVFGLIGSD